MCGFLFVPVFSVYPCVFIGCQAGSCEGLGVHLRMYVCICGEAVSHCGPPARPGDSWGPLRQLRPTARSDSVIMGCLLLWFPLTHARTHTRIHTRTQTTQFLVSRGLFPGCCPTRPQQGSTALHRRGKKQYLISQLSCLTVRRRQCSGDCSVFGGDKEAGQLSYASCLFFCLPMCLSLW